MSYRVSSQTRLTVDLPRDEAERGVAMAMRDLIFAPSWKRTPQGFRFWFYGDEANGSSGELEIAEGAARRTRLRLRLELHQSRGGPLRALIDKIGLVAETRYLSKVLREEARIPLDG